MRRTCTVHFDLGACRLEAAQHRVSEGDPRYWAVAMHAYIEAWSYDDVMPPFGLGPKGAAVLNYTTLATLRYGTPNHRIKLWRPNWC